MAKGVLMFLVDPGSIGGLLLGPHEVAYAYGTVGGLVMLAGLLLGYQAIRSHGLRLWAWPMVIAAILPDAALLYLAYAMPSDIVTVCLCLAVECFGCGFAMANADDYENPYPLFPPYVVMYHDSDYWGSGAMQNKSWMQVGPYIRQYGIAAGMAVQKGNASQYDLNFAEGCTVYQTSESNPKEFIAKLTYSAEEQEIVTDVKTDLNTYVKETMAAWITGAQVLDDASWDAFQKQVEALNAAGWLACAQAAYDRSVGK